MRTRRQISILMTAVAITALTGCGKKATEPPPDNTPATRIIVMRDSAFTPVEATTGNGIYDFKFVLALNDFITTYMSLDTTVGRINKGSIVSDSNNTAIQLNFPAMEDSLTLAYDSCRTLVLEFYLRADSLCHTNFIAFLGKEGGSNRNSTRYVGMGFDASDSVKYVYSVDQVANQQSKSVAQIQLHHWYKCSTEFTFADTTVAYYLDDVLVGHIPFQSTKIEAISYDMFVVYRNGSGANGPAPYYLNDLTIYKKK
jgi:hypothetical protein